MKKFVALLLVLALALPALALAEGKSKVIEKTWIMADGDFYFYAKVENVGDEPIYLDSGDLVIFDTDDELLKTESYVSAYPRYLEPGQYAYVRQWIYKFGDDPSVVGDVKFSISKRDRISETFRRLACSAVYDSGDAASKYDDCFYVTFTNDTDEIIFSLGISVALLDEEGHLLCVRNDTSSYMGIHPGGTVTYRLSLDSDIADYLIKNKIVPASVDAIVYY